MFETYLQAQMLQNIVWKYKILTKFEQINEIKNNRDFPI